jgi:hypothetical protein
MFQNMWSSKTKAIQSRGKYFVSFIVLAIVLGVPAFLVSAEDISTCNRAIMERIRRSLNDSSAMRFVPYPDNH